MLPLGVCVFPVPQNRVPVIIENWAVIVIDERREKVVLNHHVLKNVKSFIVLDDFRG